MCSLLLLNVFFDIEESGNTATKADEQTEEESDNNADNDAPFLSIHMPSYGEAKRIW